MRYLTIIILLFCLSAESYGQSNFSPPIREMTSQQFVATQDIGMNPEDLSDTEDFFKRRRRQQPDVPDYNPPRRSPRDPVDDFNDSDERQPIFNGPIVRAIRGLLKSISDMFFGIGFGMGTLVGAGIIFFAIGILNQVMTPWLGADWARTLVSGTIMTIKGIFQGIFDGFTKNSQE